MKFMMKRRKIAPSWIFAVSCIFLFVVFVNRQHRQPNESDIVTRIPTILAGRGSDDELINENLGSIDKLSLEDVEVEDHENSTTIYNSIKHFNASALDVLDVDEFVPSGTEIEQSVELYVKSVEESVLPELDALSNPEEIDEQNMVQKFLQETVSTLLSAMENAVPNSKEDALAKQRKDIKDSLQNYTSDEFGVSKYTIENGGTPLRNIIFTTWRSGSTFLGEAIANHPAMFYHYEPLLNFEIVQVRSGPLVEEGLHVIRQLLECNYTNLQNYINYGKLHANLHTHNFRLWNHCSRNRELCNDPDFLSKMCQMFPFQTMKTVRMRLSFAESLLADEKLNVRVLFLVRDPRGIMQSRKHREWCPPSPDCIKPSRLCSDMVSDYEAAAILRRKFPDNFLMIRYEDISLNPIDGVKYILDFFRLSYHQDVDTFIKTHTVNTIGGVSSTFRDSKSTPFQWIKYFTDINNRGESENIQEQCGEAMQLWGYAPLSDLVDNNNTASQILLKTPWPEMIIPQYKDHVGNV